MPETVPSDVAAMFEELFGQVFGAPHVVVALEITGDEAAAGVTRDVTFDRRSPCTACKGRGSTNPDTIITKCKACNGAGKKTHAQGFFQVQSICERCKGDAKYVSDPCATCAGRGTCAETTTQTVTVPAGVAHEQRLLLKGAGSLLADGSRGDVYITIVFAGRPRSKPPMAAEYMLPTAAPLPEARVHRSGQLAGPTMSVRAVAIGAAFVVLLLAILLLR